MGCFSYHCKECGEAIREKEGVKLYLLHEGKVLEEMEGNYTLYGEVEGKEWKNDIDKIFDLHFNNFRNDGIAAIHSDCFDGTLPTTSSEDDEEQGDGKAKHAKSKKSTHTYYKPIIKSKRDIERDKGLEDLGDRMSKTIAEAEKFLEELKKKK